MSKLYSIVNCIFIIFIVNSPAFSASHENSNKKQPVVITSQSLTANNKENTAVFEGSVVATTEDFTLYADTMTVYSDENAETIKKILANGNIKVVRSTSVLTSEEATYYADEEKIIFTGNPKAVQKGNVITGSEIVFFIEDERAVVRKSRVILKNKKEFKK